MATFVGGDTIEAKVIHPDIGTFTFLFKADEDCNIKLPGFKTDDDDASVTGSGKFIKKMNRVVGKIEFPPTSWDQLDAKELNILQAMSNSPILGDWTVTNVSGQIYGGLGCPVGDLMGNANTAQIPLVCHFETLTQLA